MISECKTENASFEILRKYVFVGGTVSQPALCLFVPRHYLREALELRTLYKVNAKLNAVVESAK